MPLLRVDRALLRRILAVGVTVLAIAASVSAESVLDAFGASQPLPPALRDAYVLLNGRPATTMALSILGDDVVAAITYDTGRAPLHEPRVGLSYGVRLVHRHPSDDPSTPARDEEHDVSIGVTWFASRAAAEAEMSATSSVPYGSFGERSVTSPKSNRPMLALGYWVQARRGAIVVSWSAGTFACVRDRERGGWTSAFGGGGSTPPEDVYGLEVLPAILARAPQIDVAAVVAARLPGTNSVRQNPAGPGPASTGTPSRPRPQATRQKPSGDATRQPGSAPGRPQDGRARQRDADPVRETSRGGRPEDAGSPPVSPGAAAAAGAATALVTTLGALWMLGASGLAPSDLLGAPPPAPDASGSADASPMVDAPEPLSVSAAPSPPSTPAATGIPCDGAVDPATGEVWSDANGGWVGENLYRQEQAWQAEIERAQAVSHEESRRDSAEIAEEWRRSRDARAGAAERATELGRQVEELAALRPVRIEEYQPGWADRVETGLEWMQWGADESIGILEKFTGPAGESVSKTYSIVKTTAGSASQGVAEWLRSEDPDASLAWAVAKGVGIGGAEVVKGMAVDAVVGKVSSVLKPGLLIDQIELPGIDVGEESLGAVTSMLLDPDDPLASGILETMGESYASGRLDDEIKAPIESALEAATGEGE